MEQWIVDKSQAPETLVATLQKFGFVIVPDALEASSHSDLCSDLCQQFEAAEFCQGLFYGQRTKRFGRLLSRSDECQKLATNELALNAARQILGEACIDIQLNLTQAIEIWPDSPSQVPHRDQEIWYGSEQRGELMLNAMWALDDFTEENGATIIWPGTHLEPGVLDPVVEPISAVMPKGSLCLFLGSTLHCGGANWSKHSRRGVVISYCLGWIKSCENSFLSYPPQVAREFSEELRHLIGYRMDAPSLNNVEGRCPSELLNPTSLNSAYADRLTDEQVQRIEEFNNSQVEVRRKAA